MCIRDSTSTVHPDSENATYVKFYLYGRDVVESEEFPEQFKRIHLIQIYDFRDEEDEGSVHELAAESGSDEDDRNFDRVLVFGTSRNLELFRNSTKWLSYGTVKTSPRKEES